MVLNRLRSLSPIDAVAGVVALAALGGVIWSPKLSNAVAKATGAVKPVQVSVDVRHLLSADPEQLLNAAREEAALNIVIRNQPAGRVTLVSVDDLTPPWWRCSRMVQWWSLMRPSRSCPGTPVL